jgi:hypothetical protein
MYKGMAAPLATVALFNAVLFASRGQMEALLAHKDGEQRQAAGLLLRQMWSSPGPSA